MLSCAIYLLYNARPHTARISQQYLQGYNTRLQCPARSPDSAPIEHDVVLLRRQRKWSIKAESTAVEPR